MHLNPTQDMHRTNSVSPSIYNASVSQENPIVQLRFIRLAESGGKNE